MKKSIVAVLLAMCLLLPACDAASASGSTNTDSSSEETSSPNDGGGNEGGAWSYEKDVPVEAYKGGEVTVSIHHTLGMSQSAALADAISQFNVLYPNIHIQATQISGSYDGLFNAVNAGLETCNAPTVALCYPEHILKYNEKKAVVPLDGYVNGTETVTRADGSTETMGFTAAQKNDFYAILYREGRLYGDFRRYTLPLHKSSEVMYYNKTKFDELGLTVPTTWNEMETVCAALKAADPNCIPLGYDSEENWFITMTEQLGSGYTSAEGEYFVFDNAENHAFVEMLRGWYDKGYFTTKEIYADYTSNLLTAREGRQRCYMSIDSTASVSRYVGDHSFEIAVAPVPQANTDASKHKTILKGPSVCLFKQEDPQEVAAAWLLVKYIMTSTSYQCAASMQNGYIPVIESALENANYQSWLAQLDDLTGTERNAAIRQMVAKQSIAQMDSYFISPVFDGSAAAQEEVGALLQNCLVDRIPEDKTVAEFIQGQFAQSVATLKSTDNQ